MKRRLLPYLFTAPALLVLLALAAVPIFEALRNSFFHDLNLPGEVPRYVGVENFVQVFQDRDAREALIFTILFVAVSVPVEVILGTLLALVLHRTFRGRGVVRGFVLVPWATPTVVTAWMWWYFFAGGGGLPNLLLHGRDTGAYASFLTHVGWARGAVILADVWKTAPFAALIVLAGLQTIPGELYEAARLDGAGGWRSFFEITLPLLRPALLVALLFRTMDAFRVFDLVFVMTRGAFGTSVLQYLGYQRLIVEQNIGEGCAVAVIVFLLTAVVSVLLVRAVGSRLFEGRAA